MKELKTLLFTVSMLVATGVPGCGSGEIKCAAGETVWVCTAPPSSPYCACATKVCASDQASALAAGIPKVKAAWSLPETPSSTQCFNNHDTSYYPGTLSPSVNGQTNPSCLVTDGDDACVTCAMSACCADYNACAADMNCSCLVGCLYQGNSITTCTNDCGAADSVSVSTAACLNASCPSQCANPGGMGSAMCPDMGTGGGGGSGPTCTPGATGAGESCFSDGDCASCECNTQTMTCN